MDIKILAAVFVSLAAVFTGMDGGVFSESDVRDIQSTTGFEAPQASGSFLSDLPVIDRFMERPEPGNELEAQIVVERGSEMKLRNAELEAQNLREINSPNINIESDEDIEFRKFNGRVEFGNSTNIIGNAAGLESSGVNISTSVQLDTNLETELINVRNTEKTNFKFSEASIRPLESSEFPIDTDNSNVNVKSFTGDIEVYTQNRTLNLQGQVHRVKAGKVTYGTS